VDTRLKIIELLSTSADAVAWFEVCLFRQNFVIVIPGSACVFLASRKCWLLETSLD